MVEKDTDDGKGSDEGPAIGMQLSQGNVDLI